jgi:hypothetical protein
MLKPRTHTFYLKNLNIDHPLKKLYEKVNTSQEDLNNYKEWKNSNAKFTDNYVTNVRIVFD